MKVPTMTIDVNGKPVLINRSDFDDDKHKAWSNEAPEAKAVHKGGGRWVVEVAGKQVNDDYLTRAEAKALVAEQ